MADVSIPDGLEPIAVWDPAAYDWYASPETCEQRVAWARRHMPRPGDTTYAEFHLIDAPFMVLHHVKRNASGRIYLDPGTGQVALEPPVIVPLGELPPAHLLRTP
jgi:hypothetical protein